MQDLRSKNQVDRHLMKNSSKSIKRIERIKVIRSDGSIIMRLRSQKNFNYIVITWRLQ